MISIVFSQDLKSGYILEIRDNNVYLDFKSGDVTIGSKLQVIKEGSYFTHPVTGEKIKEDDETIAILEIIDVKANYSIATVYPKEAITKLKRGTKVSQIAKNDQTNKITSGIFKKSIAVQPLTVLNIRGYLGIYISDVLTEQLLENGTFRILDRQTLGLQPDQMVLSSGGVLNETELLKYSVQNGADYYITGTMYEPDVVELSTGIPVKNIVSLVGHAAEAVTGKDLKTDMISEFVPDKIDIKRLKAVVKISLRVVDVKNGEIKFFCTEMQQAEGESDINLEGGLLGGLKIRGGVTSFQNTITGKATQLALKNLISYIIEYFNGKISTKTYTGNIIEISELNKRVPSAEILITNVVKKPVDILKASTIMKDTAYFVTLNHGQDLKIREKSYLKVYSPSLISSKITNEEYLTKNRVIGHINIMSSFSKTSEGKLILKQNFNKSQFDPDKSFARKKILWNTLYLVTRIKIPESDSTKGLNAYPVLPKSSIGLGYMIYNNFGGAYAELSYYTHNRINDPSRRLLIVSGGVMKKVGQKTGLRAGISYYAYFPILLGDITIFHTFTNGMSLVSGLSFGNSNLLFSLGMGYTF